jgi:transcription initiation factor TFIIH subunit 2
MVDSDDDFIADDSSDDLADHRVSGRRDDDSGSDFDDVTAAAARHSRRAARKRKKARDEQAAWETVKRSWDTVDENADGRLVGLELFEAERRRRVFRDTTSLQRGIIRHVILVLDMSEAMAQKDYLPTLFRAVIKLAIEFVREFFEQNPISQLGIQGMRDGVAVRISEMGGNPADHVDKLREWEEMQPQGNASLQNALEMCRGQLL